MSYVNTSASFTLTTIMIDVTGINKTLNKIMLLYLTTNNK